MAKKKKKAEELTTTQGQKTHLFMYHQILSCASV